MSEKATHVLKTDPGVFQQSWDRSKPWEIRFNDRDFREGDIVRLRETTRTGYEMAVNDAPLEYTGREIYAEIGYVLHGPAYGLDDGWCVFSTLDMHNYVGD